MHGSVVTWSNLVWHNLQIPRFSFFFWLALHKRLVTWPLLRCSLCAHSPESFMHLFFDCSYSRSLLSTILAFQVWFGIIFDWDQLLQHIQHSRMDHMASRIMKLYFATIIYKIWNECNRETHNVAAALAQDCIKIVKCRLYYVKNFSIYIDKCPYLRIWQLYYNTDISGMSLM